MPLFEHQYRLEVRGPDGKMQKVPPLVALQHVGPVLNVIISPTKEHLEALTAKGESPPSSISGLAIIDTGATSTAVDESVCRRLEIKPTGLMKTAHAGGTETRACYPIQVTFPGTPLPSFTSHRAMCVNLQFGKTPYVLLFGRDLLSRLRFVYNGPVGRIEVAF